MKVTPERKSSSGDSNFTKVVLPFLSVALPVLIFILAISICYFHQKAEFKNREKLATSTLNRLVLTLSAPIWALDHSQAQAVVDSELNEDFTKRILVFEDFGGENRIYVGRDASNETISDSSESPIGEFLKLSAKIHHEDQSIATIELYHSLESMHRNNIIFYIWVFSASIVFALMSYFLCLGTLSLIAARQNSEDANAAKSMFLASMSHEIRTPLNGLLGILDLLCETNLNASQRESVMVARKSGDLLLNILNDILDLSKIEAGKLEIVPGEFDADIVIGEVLALFKSVASKKKIRIHSKIANPGSNVFISDELRIRQVLHNLVGNATKFTPESGEICVELQQLKTGNGVMAEFIVRDTGVGIPVNRIKQLFQAFEQVTNSETRKLGGTGLGLVISKKIIELMQGTIGVESIEGHGTTFTFSIPVTVVDRPKVTQEPEIITPAKPLADFSIIGLKILLAEDNHVNQKVATALLSKRGATIEIAENGAVAVDMYRANAFDLILMDMQMPEMDGLEATRKIRALEESGQHIPIIALTANVMREEENACRAAGMDGFVPKPLDIQKLLNAIRVSLQNPT